MTLAHHYEVGLVWTGNRGSGTTDYKSYGRDHVLSASGKHDIAGSSDRVFHGDIDRWNPEELLLGALSQCHLLSFLHVAAAAGVVVTAYRDDAVGSMVQTANGGGHFVSATLRPEVTVATVAMAQKAMGLHGVASERCFIAASVNFPVGHEPSVLVAAA
jgi:organic hydroperoxide reductase OsmC/OhrA